MLAAARKYTFLASMVSMKHGLNSLNKPNLLKSPGTPHVAKIKWQETRTGHSYVRTPTNSKDTNTKTLTKSSFNYIYHSPALLILFHKEVNENNRYVFFP